MVSDATTSPPLFDSRPLEQPVDRTAVARWHREASERGLLGSPSMGTVVGTALGGVAMLVTLSLMFSIIADMADPSASSLMTVLLLVACAVVAVVSFTGYQRNRAKRYRLHLFAEANHMEYVPHVDAPPLPGMIFGIGDARAADNVVRGRRPRFVEFGNYRYTTGSGKNRSTHRWGYVAIRLDAPLPNIVLDAAGNNSILGSTLPSTIDRSQRLRLEGDFDRYFSLYAPSGYEADALYLFTPDIMARFIDNAAQLDAEIVDDWLFLYTPREVTTLDPATWAWLFSVVRALLGKLDRWGRWRDERLQAEDLTATAVASGSASPEALVPPVVATAAFRAPRGVAPAGRRLKRGSPWAIVAVIAALVSVSIWFVAEFVLH